MPWFGLLVLGAADCNTIPVSLACSSNVQARVSDRPIWPIWIHHEPTSAFPVSHKPQHAWIWAKGQEASQSSIRQSALMISGRRFASCQLNPFKSQRGGLQTSLSEKNQWVTPRTFVESIFSVLLHLRLVHGWAISPSVVEVLLPVVKYYYYYVVYYHILVGTTSTAIPDHTMRGGGLSSNVFIQKTNPIMYCSTQTSMHTFSQQLPVAPNRIFQTSHRLDARPACPPWTNPIAWCNGHLGSWNKGWHWPIEQKWKSVKVKKKRITRASQPLDCIESL